MYKKILYRKAYRILENSTPLKFDCGLLCGGKCCSGDSDKGMCLFPGEEIMFEKSGGFLTFRKEKLLGTDVLFAVCSGTCNRIFRPLSCRIFPFAPYLDESGRLTVMEDPRSKYLCPLLLEGLEFKIDKIFKRKVFNVFSFLVQDSDINNHVRLLSGILDEYSRFMY